MRSIRALLLGLSLIACVGIAFYANSQDYLRYMFTFICMYATLAVSLDLFVGLTGRIAGSHATFFGIGAYTVGVATTRLGMDFFAALILGVVLAAIAAAMFGQIALRLTGIYFALSTMSLGIIFADVVALHDLKPWTGGINGLVGVMRPVEISDNSEYLMIFLTLLILVSGLRFAIARSHIGRVLRSIRDDEELALSLGIQAQLYKVSAFTLSSALAGLVGAIFAVFFGFVAPTSADIWQSFNVLVWVLVGGSESVVGPILGTALLWTLPQVLHLAPAVTQVIYGGSLAMMIALNKKGLVGVAGSIWRLISSRLRRAGGGVQYEANRETNRADGQTMAGRG